MAGERRAQFLAIITKETDRLTRLINQVLDLARIEAGRAEWRVAGVDMRSLLADALARMSQVFQERGIVVQLRSPERVPVVRADVDRIIQVVLNLLSNAAKFCEAGKGRVEIGLVEDDGFLRVDVRDNGPGVDARDREIIFDKFRQAAHSSGGGQGSGLGLHICRRIVEHFGGRIWVTSGAGKGSCFSFTLPCSDVTLSRQAA
jgi:signal transduction histidine kinase